MSSSEEKRDSMEIPHGWSNIRRRTTGGLFSYGSGSDDHTDKGAGNDGEKLMSAAAVLSGFSQTLDLSRLHGRLAKADAEWIVDFVKCDGIDAIFQALLHLLSAHKVGVVDSHCMEHTHTRLLHEIDSTHCRGSVWICFAAKRRSSSGLRHD